VIHTRWQGYHTPSLLHDNGPPQHKGRIATSIKGSSTIINNTMADPKTCPPLTRASVVAAHDIVRPHVHRTPVLTNSTLSQLASTPAGDRPGDKQAAAGGEEEEEGKAETKARPVIRLWFKCENLQRVGAFKVRGAFHAVERLKADSGWVAGGGMSRGVVTHSSGEFCLFFLFPLLSCLISVFFFSIYTYLPTYSFAALGGIIVLHWDSCRGKGGAG
jgi:hypothetical protein